MGWADYLPACDRYALIGDPVLDVRRLMAAALVGRGSQWAGALGAADPPAPPPRDPEAARATLRALGWVFPEVEPDGTVLRRERRLRCDVGDAARGPIEQAVVAAVRAGRREGED